MKSIQIDDDLYHYIASQTQHIGESASDILRRLVLPDSLSTDSAIPEDPDGVKSSSSADVALVHTNQQPCQANAVFAELQSQQLQAIPKMVERWLLVLSILHKHHQQTFSKVLGMSGRNRTYFAKDKATLLASGSSTNPKNVPGSEYWVITNNNTQKKRNMLAGVAREIGFNGSEVEQLEKIFAPELQD